MKTIAITNSSNAPILHCRAYDGTKDLPEARLMEHGEKVTGHSITYNAHMGKIVLRDGIGALVFSLQDIDRLNMEVE